MIIVLKKEEKYMREYRVKVTVRNNLLLSAIEDAGYTTQADFARAIGVGLSQLNAMVGLRDAPINNDGNFSDLAKTLMEALGACPTDLWTEEQLTMKLRKSSASTVVDKYELLAVLGKNSSELVGFNVEQYNEDYLHDLKKVVAEKLDTLTPRERKVLQLRFGIDAESHTLSEVGNMMDMTGEGIRAIEAKALHKMRHRSRSDQLKPYLEEEL
jgi:DNA-binding CsgD family transcriptional regulator